jgi:tetratricopeptide (TPR) repeat protein
MFRYAFLLAVGIWVADNVYAQACGGTNFATLQAKGADCYGKNNFPQAINFLEKQIKDNPSDKLSLARLAISHTRLEKHKEAIEFYKKAIAAGWISYDFAALYSRSLFEIGEKEDSIKWGWRSIEIAPNCIDCRKELSWKLAKTGKKAEAKKLLIDFDNEQLAKGKPQYFKGQLMLLEDL